VRLIGREKLARIDGCGQDAGVWVSVWASEIAYANWRQPVDVVKQFPRARLGEGGRCVFPLSQSSIGIHALIDFARAIVLVTAVENDETNVGH
jgi:mRNA-degrading endonuclease HigB of HigAB toxin-antitoxin module